MKSFPCFKRDGAPCPVLAPGAVQETNGVFDNDKCACAHPSSLAPVLGAADATVVVLGPGGERRLALGDLYASPKQGKASDTTLGPGDVIVAVEVPKIDYAGARNRVAFTEVRQRAAFDWALVSCAVRTRCDQGVVKEARVWLGAVAPTPWRAAAAEKALVGAKVNEATAAAAGDAAVQGATPLPGNAYKLDLIRVAVKRAVLTAGGC
jgi:xanthine dehydrogenase YagS FAD-binding subunit